MTREFVQFYAHGIPASKGSKDAIPVPVPAGGRKCRCGQQWRATLIESASKKLGPWNRAMRLTAHNALIGMDWKPDGPMNVALQFFFQRPKNHHVSGDRGKPLRASAPKAHLTYPDADKCARAVLDALKKAGAYEDDAQVVVLTATKDYGDEPGCQVTVERLA